MKRINPKAILKKPAIGIVLLVIAAFGLGLVVSSLFSSTTEGKHAGHGKASAGDTTASVTWTCSMHPQVKQPEPGLCPLCGMDLIPLKDDGDDPGPRSVILSERAKVLAQISTTAVKRKAGSSTDLRLLGRIDHNETAMKNVTAWTGGRIDRLHVKVTGESVRAGQTIASLYSPEIFAAHQDLLVAKRQLKRMSGGAESSKIAAQRAYDASRNRLSLLGIQEKVIEKLETQEKPSTRIAIRTPFTGTVVERVATEGAYVETGALLYKIVDLKDVWVQLDAYESDLSGISIGQEVQFEVEGIEGETFTGKVTFIDPILDPVRRISRVRVEVENKEGKLRPGMFVQADVKSSLEKGIAPPLIIPDTAPLFTGRRAIVFVEEQGTERPIYTARTVRLGLKTGNQYPVIAGLSAGERVVTKGAFTLDADLQIRGGNSMMTQPDDSTSNTPNAIIQITAKERQNLVPVLKAYLELQKQLAADNLDKAKEAADTLAKATMKSKISGPKPASVFWKAHSKHLHVSARHLIETGSIEEARGVFENLSNQTIVLLERLGNPLDVPVRLAFCPMAMGSKGAHWVQASEVVDNSYYGDAMRTCGEIKNTIAAGSYLLKEQSAAPIQAAPAGGHQH